MLYCYAACPEKDIIKATGGEMICCKDDTCLVDVPLEWGSDAFVTAYYPTTPYDGKAMVPWGDANQLTLALGTCTYPNNDYWLCKTVRLCGNCLPSQAAPHNPFLTLTDV